MYYAREDKADNFFAIAQNDKRGSYLILTSHNINIILSFYYIADICRLNCIQ